MSPEGIVEATERLYRSLFSAAVVFVAAMAAWGLVIAPFNAFRGEHVTGITLGLALVLGGLATWHYRRALFALLRRQHAWLLLAVAVGIAALWIDGGWRSSYYLASYSAIALAIVVAGLRWSLTCAALLAVGYVGGLALHGYSWAELQDLKDADSIVANTGGYLFAAAFAVPVAWLGGYVARINQIAGRRDSAEPRPGSVQDPAASAEPACVLRLKTANLSVREVEVAQLVAAGLTNQQVADTLILSHRTVQRHVDRAMKKTGAKNRAQLAAIAVREGIVPPADEGRSQEG